MSTARSRQSLTVAWRTTLRHVGENGVSSDETPPPRLFRTRAFVVPYLAETQSIAGDQIGRVALSILVFDRTNSAAWTALTYALTFLPAILGGILLGDLGDRLPRGAVMIGTDALRSVLFLAVAVPGVPLPVGVGLVAVAFFLGPLFTASMVSQLAASLSRGQFRTASGIRMITSQAAQVGGFAVGGLIVAAIGPHSALLVDAATFAGSALIVGTLLGLGARARGAGTPSVGDGAPADEADTADAPSTGAAAIDTAPAAGQAGLWRNPMLRTLMLMAALSAFFVVPEGLAVPVAHALGGSSRIAGLLLAAGPLGSAIGAAILVKWVPPRHGLSVARTLSIACGVPLLASVLFHNWPAMFVCWALSGALWAYQVDVATGLAHAVDDSARSRTLARASAVLLGAQGVGLIVFGVAGQAFGARQAVALAGGLGIACAVLVAAMTRPILREVGDGATSAPAGAGPAGSRESAPDLVGPAGASGAEAGVSTDAEAVKAVEASESVRAPGAHRGR